MAELKVPSRVALMANLRVGKTAATLADQSVSLSAVPMAASWAAQMAGRWAKRRAE